MRVGLVCPYSWRLQGGVQSHVAGLAQALRARGVDAEILAPEGGDHDLGSSVPIPSNGSVQRVALHPATVRRTARLVGRYDLVHLHEPMLPAACLTALLSAPVPLVGTFHMYRRALLWYAVFGPLVRPAARRLDAGLAVSRAAAEYARRGTGRMTEVVPNGIDYDELASLPHERRGGRRILFVGRDEPRKGLGVLRRAHARLSSRAELVVIGPDRPVPHARLLDELSRADVLAAPSLRGESFGLVLAEAMAAGVPVVASDIPGYRDVLRAGGVLVPPGDPAALGAALDRLLGEDDERCRLGQAGRREAAQYAWPRVAERVLAVYERVLA